MLGMRCTRMSHPTVSDTLQVCTDRKLKYRSCCGDRISMT